MFEILKLMHVVGWAAWFGLAIAEASAGVQVRKATDAGGRAALARLWARVGRMLVGAMGLTLIFGLALLAFEMSSNPLGGAGYMRDHAYLFVHVMLGLGLLAGVLVLFAARSRSAALAAIEAGNTEGFAAPYKRAAMFSGMSSLLVVAIMAEVYLHTM